MARNEEKGQLMMNRWVDSVERGGAGVQRGKRPYLASECDDVKDAEYWRREIIKEITILVRDIQNAGLGEHTLRDMNDLINKKLREKGHWERRIRELGGPNYKRSRSQFDGESVKGNQGYMYFGAVKNLPGVRELFEKPKARKQRRTRHDMYKNVDPDYYGYRDEESGTLILAEMDAEVEMVEEAMREWRSLQRKRRENGETYEKEPDPRTRDNEAEAGVLDVVERVPDQDEIEKIILERKKRALLERFSEGGHWAGK